MQPLQEIKKTYWGMECVYLTVMIEASRKLKAAQHSVKADWSSQVLRG